MQHGSPLKHAASSASTARDHKLGPHLEEVDFKLMASELTSLQTTLTEDLRSIGDQAMVQLLSLGRYIMSVSACSESHQLGPPGSSTPVAPAPRAVLSRQVRTHTTRCKVLHLGMAQSSLSCWPET